MIMVGKASCFWELGRVHMPEIMSRFDLLRRVLELIQQGRIDPRHEDETLEFIYRKVQPANFSRHVLSRAPAQCLAFPLEGIEWSDWGRAERIRQSLAQFEASALEGSPLASAI